MNTMKDRTDKNHEPCEGWSKNEKMRMRIWEERGYGVSRLDKDLVDVYAPDKEDHHLTFISTHFNGNTREMIERYALKAWKKRSVPINPYLMYGAMFPVWDTLDQNRALLFSLMLLMHCDELWIIARSSEELKGHVSMEMRLALSFDIPIRFFNPDKDVDEEEDEYE